MEERPCTVAMSNAPCGPMPSPQPAKERTPRLLAFLCLIIPAIPNYLVFAGPLKSNGSPAKLIAVLFFFLAAMSFVLLRRTSKTQALRPGIILVLLYFLLELLIYAVGITHLGDAVLEASKTRWMIVTIAHTGIALAVLTRVQTPHQRTVLLGCMAIGLTFACLVGILQTTSIDLRYLFRPPGFVVNAEDVDDLSERFGAKRVLGTSAHPIEFSVLSAITVPLTLHFARFATSTWVRWLAKFACLLALIAMPAAVSRTGIIAIAAAFMVYIWNFRVRAIASTFVGGAIAVAAYFSAFPGTANALLSTVIHSDEDPSISHRTNDYAIVSETFRAHPVFGLGLGAAPPSEYGFLDSEWLQAIVQGGLLGITAMFILAGGVFFGISASLRVARGPRERDQAYMIGSVLVSIVATSFTFDLFSYQQASLLFFIFFALQWSGFEVRRLSTQFLEPPGRGSEVPLQAARHN